MGGTGASFMSGGYSAGNSSLMNVSASVADLEIARREQDVEFACRELETEDWYHGVLPREEVRFFS